MNVEDICLFTLITSTGVSDHLVVYFIVVGCLFYIVDRAGSSELKRQSCKNILLPFKESECAPHESDCRSFSRTGWNSWWLMSDLA